MATRRGVEVYKPDGVLYKRYKTITEMSKDMEANLSTISAALKKGNLKVKVKGVEYILVPIEGEEVIHEGETEDQIRRRLGLNPYGEWRNDEWMNAMFERVNKILYPDGYDTREIWLAQKANNRAKKRAANLREEKEAQETYYNSIEDFDKDN
jgi:hypothetical protein